MGYYGRQRTKDEPNGLTKCFHDATFLDYMLENICLLTSKLNSKKKYVIYETDIRQNNVYLVCL